MFVGYMQAVRMVGLLGRPSLGCSQRRLLLALELGFNGSNTFRRIWGVKSFVASLLAWFKVHIM